VREALGSLPWVDKGSIRPDVSHEQVSFNVTDPKRFNEEQIRSALREQDFPTMEVLKRP
jgi:hypothetical protein